MNSFTKHPGTEMVQILPVVLVSEKNARHARRRRGSRYGRDWSIIGEKEGVSAARGTCNPDHGLSSPSPMSNRCPAVGLSGQRFCNSNQSIKLVQVIPESIHRTQSVQIGAHNRSGGHVPAVSLRAPTSRCSGRSGTPKLRWSQTTRRRELLLLTSLRLPLSTQERADYARTLQRGALSWRAAFRRKRIGDTSFSSGGDAGALFRYCSLP